MYVETDLKLILCRFLKIIFLVLILATVCRRHTEFRLHLHMPNILLRLHLYSSFQLGGCVIF